VHCMQMAFIFAIREYDEQRHKGQYTDGPIRQ